MTDQMVTTESGPRLPERLTATLASLSDDRAEDLTAAECLEVVDLLEATKGAAAALQARATARFVEQRDVDAREARERDEISRREESCRRSATRAEVGLARRCSPAQADRHVRTAAALTADLPETMTALTWGRISEWRATIVVRGTSELSSVDRAEADRRLAPDLTTLGDRALAAAAHRVSVDLDQAAIVERRRRAAASRNVSVRPAPDGMAYLSVLGPLVEVVGAYAALTAAEKARFVATGDPETDAARAADDRGRGAWMADTALELLSGRSEGRLQPVEVGLVMDESVLVPRTDGTSAGADGHVEVPGWGAVAGDDAREHLLGLLDEDARVWLRRLWTSPDGRDLVTMDSRRRLFTGALRRLIELRDPTCRVPWCDAPARQVDHIDPHARGGATDAGNGWGTCQRHNLVKEEPGWIAEVAVTGLDPGGGPHEVLLSTPSGGEYRCVAAPVRGHGRPPPRPRSRLETHFERLLAAA